MGKMTNVRENAGKTQLQGLWFPKETEQVAITLLISPTDELPELKDKGG